MRITDKIIFDTMQASVMDNRDRLFLIQQQIAENKKILKPSDDPRTAEKLITLKASRSEIEQFQRNVTSGKASLEMSGNSLAEAGDLLVRAKEIAVQLSDDVYTAGDRSLAAAEVGELYNRMLAIANVKLGSEYLFSGFRSDTPPYDASGAYQGDNGSKEIRIGPNEKVALNLVGIDVFGSGASGILRDLAALRDALAVNDVAAVRTAMQEMDQGMQNIFRNQALLGARVKSMELEEGTLRNFGTEITGQIADAEDLDIAFAAMNLKKQEAAFEAALQVAGRISSLTILDVIKR
ncbi:MAG: flagellar hook-associated protein FlgL [Deltaproteobacteria bacterium]|nr:flagellar hook-associated protein FlgL [Deltaproteobacteria bacterium]